MRRATTAGLVILALLTPATAGANIVLPKHATVVEATAAKKAKKRLPRNYALWIRIGRCEQPGSGYKGINWSHPGPRYQGGLGFWSGTWQSFKVKGMPANAGQATWRQQMWVANKLYALYGTSPWGCA